jgi:hypothetical protein
MRSNKDAKLMPKLRFLLLLSLAGPLHAAEKNEPRPEILSKLVECRTVTDNAARLACFDRQVAALDEAERNADLVVVDRQQVKKANRKLFGLTVPDIGGLFDRKESDKNKVEEVTAIESILKAVGTTSQGKLIFVLEDGARWVQTESFSIRTPRPGQPIKIRKASLGSYFATVNGQPGIRVRREQ